MSWGAVFFIFLLLTAIILLAEHYGQLWRQKENYSRDDLKNFQPAFIQPYVRIKEKFSVTAFWISIFLSSLFGMAIPGITLNWFVNSIILYVVTFFLFPITVDKWEIDGFTHENPRVIQLVDFFKKYHWVINYGFGAGMVSSISFLWIYHKTSFLWFILNFIAGMAMLFYNFRKIKE